MKGSERIALTNWAKAFCRSSRESFLRSRVRVLSQGVLVFPFHFPNRRNGASFLKCRFVPRAISAGVVMLARSPSRTMASRVLAGWAVLC